MASPINRPVYRWPAYCHGNAPRGERLELTVFRFEGDIERDAGIQFRRVVL